MSVLTYGLPQRENLRCDNPVCNELAQHQIVLKSLDRKGEAISLFACTAHNAQLQVGRLIARVEKLKVAGERNALGAGQPNAPNA